MIKLKDLITEANKHRFDLTDFKSGGFQKVLRDLGIKPKAKAGKLGWEWKGNGILIVTGNNPITGEYFTAQHGGKYTVKRKKEKNYASYIGVEGSPDLVKHAVDLIKHYSTYIKGESPGKRSFI